LKFKFDLRAIWKNFFSSANAVVRALLGLSIVLLFAMYYRYGEASISQRSNTASFFQRLELLAYDMRLRATMPNKPDPRIVIIDIDEKSLAAEGRFPWGRDKMAELLKQLATQYKAKVIGFDIIFSEPDTSSGLANLEALAKTTFRSSDEFQRKLGELRPALDFDSRFAAEIQKHLVVLSFAGSHDRTVELDKLRIGALPPPMPLFDQTSATKQKFLTQFVPGYSANLAAIQNASSAAGHIQPIIDQDGVLRRIPAFLEIDGQYYESLAMAVSRTYLDNAAISIIPRRDPDNGLYQIKHISLGNDIRIPVDDEGSILVPYRGRSPSFRYISATDILKGQLVPGELDGKIALVGTSAAGLFDLRNTPVDQVYPGVEMHANLISGFLDNRVMSRPESEIGFHALLIMILGIPLALALVKLNSLSSTLLVMTASALLIAFNMYWWYEKVVLPIALPLLMAGSLYLFNMAYGFFIEARSKRQITGIFGTYVPKELVEEMAKNPGNYSTQGESREMTVLFSDVRNFTTISEGLSPKELTAMMNDYLTEMTVSIQKERGTIDKYIGDMIMAFWGAPLRDESHAEHALNSAMAMQVRLKELGPDYVKRGWPALEIGIGLNCGMMNVGDMGSSFRRAYTVLGDAVNLGSRLESLTKEYGVGILVSENIVNAVPNMIYRELDRVRVKGKLKPIGIYEPVGKKGEVADHVLDDLDRLHRALDRYREQRWDEAEKLVKALSQNEPHRKIYHLLIERIAELRANPPGANWDGVYTFTKK
jgi:adenylate cyclase